MRPFLLRPELGRLLGAACADAPEIPVIEAGAPQQLSLWPQAGESDDMDMARLHRLAKGYTAAARASSTTRAYGFDWANFTRWCREARCSSLPATESTVCLYVASQLESLRVSTVERRVAAIVDKHRRRGLAVPTGQLLKDVLSGARRARGAAPRQKAALRADDLRRICGLLARSRTSSALRDRALLLLGFAGGMRRSEIVALDVADVEFRRNGMLVTIRRSKTDQEGKGRVIGIFYGSRSRSCPVRALKAWLRVRGKEGPLFPGQASRGPGSRLIDAVVSNVVKRAVKLIGLDPRGYGAHSLRAGFVTTAAEDGMPETLIMQRTGHRSVQTVAKYVRPALAFGVDALARAL